MSSEEEQLNQLVTKAVDGDRQALEDLCAAVAPRLEQFLKGKIPSDLQTIIAVEDVLQETFVDVFCGIERGQFKCGGYASFFAWVRTIAHNNLIDAIRAIRQDRQNKHPSQQSSDRGDDSVWALYIQATTDTKDTPSKHIGRKEAITSVLRELEKLQGTHRRIIEEYDLKQRPMRAVAAELGISEGAAFMRRNRALRELRDLLGSTWRFLGDSA